MVIMRGSLVTDAKRRQKLCLRDLAVVLSPLCEPGHINKLKLNNLFELNITADYKHWCRIFTGLVTILSKIFTNICEKVVKLII